MRFTNKYRMRFVCLAGAVLGFLSLLAGQALLTVDLRNALDRAKAYNPQFLAAGTASALAREDKVQAKGALLPTVSNLSQYLYTQGNGTDQGVFVSNNGVHVYDEQAVVHADLFSVTKLADYRRAIAAEAAARARQNIALRGLSAAVMQNYYALVIAQRHLENAKRSVEEARQFLDITTKQERGGEVARADVIKAQLQLQQRQRDQMDSETNTERARIGLAVMLFSDLGQPFNVVDDLRPDTALPAMEETRSVALGGSPEIKAAEAGLQQAQYGVKSARGAYLPTLTLDYFFGIDANVFAIHGPDDRQNLGSVVQGTVTIPIWNWGTTRSKVQQAELVKRQAETDLNFAKRQIQASLNAFYLEAQAARAQIESLRGSVDLATESLRLTTLRYGAGEAVALEVVDAQSTLAQARNAYDDGLARYRLALASLETLTGRF